MPSLVIPEADGADNRDSRPTAQGIHPGVESAGQHRGGATTNGRILYQMEVRDVAPWRHRHCRCGHAGQPMWEIAVAPDVRTQACAGSQPVSLRAQRDVPMMVNQEIGALDVSPADCGL